MRTPSIEKYWRALSEMCSLTKDILVLFTKLTGCAVWLRDYLWKLQHLKSTAMEVVGLML